MIETTKEYYSEKAEYITNKLTNKIKNDIENFEGFLNIPFTKNMIRVKYEYDLENTGVTEDDVIDMTIDESIESLIYSAITKIEPFKINNIYLTNQLSLSSSIEIKEYLDYVIEHKQDDMKNYKLESIKYLYFGDNCIPFMKHLIEDLDIHNGCIGEYKGIKFFYIEKLEHIYMSNYSYIDLNTIDIRYNEYVKEDFSNIFGPDDLYENIPNYMKRGVITLNCMLGDVKLLKLNTIFGNGKMFYRKLKLQRITK